MAAQAARTLDVALTKPSQAHERLALAEGLSAVAARMEPKEAARTLIQAMSTANTDTTDMDPRFAQALTFAAVLTGADRPEQRRRTASVMACLGSTSDGTALLSGLALLRPAVQALPCRLSTAELVELLKDPLCVGAARRVLLDRLATRYGRPFADQWKFVRFADQQRLGLDCTVPPRSGGSRR